MLKGEKKEKRKSAFYFLLLLKVTNIGNQDYFSSNTLWGNTKETWPSKQCLQKGKKKGEKANMKVFSFFFYCKSLIFSPYFYIKRLLIILGIHTTHTLFGFDCKLPTTTLSVPSILSIPLFALNMSTLPLRWSSVFINNEWSRPRTIRVFNQNRKNQPAVGPSPPPSSFFTRQTPLCCRVHRIRPYTFPSILSFWFSSQETLVYLTKRIVVPLMPLILFKSIRWLLTLTQSMFPAGSNCFDSSPSPRHPLDTVSNKAEHFFFLHSFMIENTTRLIWSWQIKKVSKHLKMDSVRPITGWCWHASPWHHCRHEANNHLGWTGANDRLDCDWYCSLYSWRSIPPPL